MPEQLWFTALLNRLFAGPVDSILRAIGVQPVYPKAPITNFVAMQVLVAIFLIAFFVLICNLIGMIPGFDSPTAVPSVPLGCAIVAFFYYHYQGLKKSGVAYFKHFAGPFIWLAPLMVPIELISHLARVLSLTVRLFANMFAGDMVTLVFFSLIPIGVPIAFLGLHIGVSLLQTYIFVLLTTVYLQGAVGEEH